MFSINNLLYDFFFQYFAHTIKHIYNLFIDVIIRYVLVLYFINSLKQRFVVSMTRIRKFLFQRLKNVFNNA